jgi:hypothetical protein
MNDNDFDIALSETLAELDLIDEIGVLLHLEAAAIERVNAEERGLLVQLSEGTPEAVQAVREHICSSNGEIEL